MTEYRFARPEDMPYVIDFIDLVFSQLRVPHDFEKMIPKVYGEGRDYSDIHAVAVEDGNIRGCVAVLPYTLSVADQPLRVGFLGSVSVHRHARGAGSMRKLMEMQIERAKAEKQDVVLLGGQRQRYAYYGFSPCGGEINYRFINANMRHALKDVDATGIRFTRLEKGEGASYAFALYQQQPVCGARTLDSFVDATSNYLTTPWLIENNGQKVGYLQAGDTHIHELVLEDSALIEAVLKAWISFRDISSFTIQVAPSDVTLNRTLARYAEGYSIGQDCYMLCLNFENTIRAWMTLKNRIQPLSEGCVKLAIEGQPVLKLSVSNGEISVSATDEPADVSLKADEAVQLIFAYNRFYAPAVSGIPADWFPLPFSVPTADTF